MQEYFVKALEDLNIDENDKNEFMELIMSYEPSICSGDSSLNTLK